MSLLGRITEVVDDRAEGWLDRFLEDGRGFVDKKLEDHEAELGTAALDALEDVKAPALGLGRRGLALVVGYLEGGKEAEAQRQYVSHTATFAERNAWIEQRGDQAVDSAAERLEAWEAFKEGLTSGGEAVLKILARVLVGTLGP